MSTPFAISIEELIDLWNKMIEESNIEYDDGQDVPAGGKILHYPKNFDRYNTISYLFMFVGTVIGTYDKRLADFLRQHNLL